MSFNIKRHIDTRAIFRYFWVGKAQRRVQTHQDPHGQEPADRNDVSTLGTV